MCCFCKVKCVRGGAVQCSYAKIDHHFQLSCSISRTTWYSHCTYLLYAIMETKSTCEKTVIHSILEYISFIQTYHGKVSGHKVRPGIDVFCSVSYYSWFTASSGRCMDTNNVTFGY